MLLEDEDEDDDTKQEHEAGGVQDLYEEVGDILQV